MIETCVGGATPLPINCDVLIVGCGPVGAVLANMLGLKGVRTVIIDKAMEIFAGPRAIVLDNDALRILQLIGVDEHEFSQVRIPYVRMISRLFGEFARVNTSGKLDTHPKLVSFFQPQLEEALRRKLCDKGDCVQLALGVELLDFTEVEDGVTVRLKRPDGTIECVRTKFLVGADGASSAVRRAIGYEFKGKSFAEDWLIIDAKNVPTPIDHVEFLCDPARPTPHMVAPDGRQRWEFMLAKGEAREQMECDAEIDRLLSRWGGLDAMEIERRAVYRFHARCARSFQKGRVFLVGDAAHITPPFVGQGLVSGLRDVANLGWKLAAVTKGLADSTILDSYDVERRPHAKAMIDIARLIGRLIMPRNRIAAALVHGAMLCIRKISPLRVLLEEQAIKPCNDLRRGLFAKSTAKPPVKPGVMFPQVWLRDAQGAPVRSDDAFGQGFALVGFGVDPESHLSEAAQAMLNRLEARCLQVSGERSSQLANEQVYVADSQDGVVVRLVRERAIVLLRPDRIVLHSALSGRGQTIFAEAEKALRT